LNNEYYEFEWITLEANLADFDVFSFDLLLFTVFICYSFNLYDTLAFLSAHLSIFLHYYLYNYSNCPFYTIGITILPAGTFPFADINPTFKLAYKY
jgi:hypothetical protein